ncbi:MAG: hypothetical protein ACREK6_00175 [Candidatus Rokuibacteriota bacterium]
MVLNMPTMPMWRSVTRPQRALLIGVVASALIVITGAMPASLRMSTGPSPLLWGAFALNALLLLVLGPIALATTKRWFRQDLPVGGLRRQRGAVRRRAVLLGLIAYVAHQTLVVSLDPRFSLERLTGRRRVFSPVVTVPDRLEFAWAFTAVALGYIVLAWLLWRSTSIRDVVPSGTRPAGSSPIIDVPPPPLVATQAADAIEKLPRDPATGRVVRQFDL